MAILIGQYLRAEEYKQLYNDCWIADHNAERQALKILDREYLAAVQALRDKLSDEDYVNAIWNSNLGSVRYREIRDSIRGIDSTR
ncbi:MAG: hypothetical protein PVJ60_03965 [Phycisphaerales bacterium]